MTENCADSVGIERATPAPLESNPAAVYLASLSASGRRTMHGKLDRAARALGYANAFSSPWPDLRFQHVSAVVAKLRDEGLAPATVNTVLAALKGVARAAFNLGLVGSDEYQRIKDVRGLRYHRELSGRALDAEEAKRLFRVCNQDPRPQGRRDAAILAVLFATGMRRSELVGLSLSDYDADTGSLLVQGKGDKERPVYVEGNAKDALDAWVKVRGDSDGALFVPVQRGGRIELRGMTPEALYRTLRRRARQAGVKRFSPHDLRRTFITDSREAGADLVVLSRFVGHADVQQTAKYDRSGEQAKRRLAGLVRIPSVSGGVGIEA